MDCKERGSLARGVYPIQDTSHMGTARVKQEEESITRIIMKYGWKERRHYKRKSIKQELTSERQGPNYRAPRGSRRSLK